MASAHNLTPLLFWNLQGFEAELLPEIWSRLRMSFDANASRNFFLTSQLQAIMAELQAQEISALAYKGPALAVVAYQNILLRPFCDLDFLLRLEDMPRAGALLAQAGFTQTTHAGEASNDYAEQWVRAKSDAAPCDVVIELHWDIAARHLALPLDMKSLWDAPMTVDVGGAPLLAPARDDLFLLLAWHGYKHRWAVLEWLAAFSALVAQNEISDWPRLLEKARQSGSRRVLLLALQLAKEFFQTPLPENILTLIRNDKAVSSLAQQIGDSIFPERAPESSGKIGWYHLRSRERLRDKARYCLGLAQMPAQIHWKFSSPKI